MKTLLQTLSIVALGLSPGTLIHGQVPAPYKLLPISHALGNEFWSSPDFIRSFIGDYGFRSQIEPRIDRKEQELLRKVISQAQTDHLLAIATLEKAIKPDSSAALDFTLATLRFQNGKLTRAAEGYKIAIGKLPSFLRAHKNLGLVLVQQGHFDEAAGALLKAISHGENEGVTFVALGYCYLMLEKYASAENAYRAAILRNPEAKDAQNGLVNCLLETDRHAEAAAMLDELIAKYPEHAFYWRAQTNAYVELGKPLRAAINLETLRRMGELDGRGHLLLGDLYHNLELPALALLVYRGALGLQGDLDAGRFIRVASILIDRGSYEEGFDYLDRIEAKFSQGLNEEERLDLLGLRARIAFALGEQEEADSYLATILRTNPNNGQALLLRGRHFWKRKNDPVEAAFYFERAAKVVDTARDALVEHAQMLVVQEKYSEAVKMLERAQLLEPRENVERYLKSVRNVMRVKGKGG
ncbi:MAG: tetratricopeptide repeat protein [Opitutales bacterium]